MNKLKYLIGFVCFIISFQVFGRVSLSDDNFEQINNNLTLGIMGLGIHYGEQVTKDSPEKPDYANDTETGVIPGLFLTLRKTFDKKVYAELHADYSTGKLKYDGALSKYPYLAKVDRNNHRIINADVKAGYILIDKEFFQIIPYLSLGYRFWDRFYNDLTNHEKYSNLIATAGIKTNYMLNDDLFLSPYIQGGEVFNGKMRVIEGDRNYNLGSQPIYQAGLEMNYRLSDEFFLNGFINFTHFQYVESQWFGCIVEGVSTRCHEPSSKTNEIKVGIGITYNFIP